MLKTSRCALAIATSLLLPMAACSDPSPVAGPSPTSWPGEPGESGQVEASGEFEDTLELLAAVEAGTFAERTGLDEELAKLSVPGPVQVDFVKGTRVPADQLPKIEEIARALMADARLRVDVVGCSDPSGSRAVNRRISEARAVSVAERLQKLGVPGAQLGEVVGRGESCDVPERMVRIEPSLADPQA